MKNEFKTYLQNFLTEEIIIDDGIKPVSIKQALLFTFFDIIFFGLKWAFMLNMAYVLFTVFLKVTLPIYQTDICPILMK